MNNDYIETFKKIGETSYENSKEVADINSKVLVEIGEQYMAVANLFMETGTAQIKALNEKKAYKDIVANQTEVISDVSDKLLGIARNTADIMTEYKENCAALCDKSVKESQAFVKSA